MESEVKKRNGFRWYTNGLDSIAIKPNEPIPPNFYPGRIHPPRVKHDSNWCTNGHRRFRLKHGEKLPPGYVMGRKYRKPPTVAQRVWQYLRGLGQ
jgi:hypothetical protein